MKRLLLLAALAAASVPAQAQDFFTAVSTTELTNNGAIDVDFGCAVGSDGAFVWFNFPTQEILVHNPELPSGSRTTVLHSAAELDALAGVDVDRCRAAGQDPEGDDFGVFALASSADNVDFLVLAISEELEVLIGPDGSADGITGLTVGPDGETVYVARGEFFGAPEDGVYVLVEDGGDFTLEPVVTDPDLSLVDLAADAQGNLYALSDNFGAGDYQDVIVKVTDPAGSADLSVFADPFDLFTGERRDLSDLEVGVVNGTEYLFAANNSFSDPDGEEVARYTLDGSGVLLFSQADVLADPDVDSGDWAIPGGPNNLILDPFEEDLYLLNTDRFGGADEILGVTGIAPVAVEDGPTEAGVALAAWPNPAAGRLTVALTVDRAQAVRVTVLDALGRQVAVLHDGVAAAGRLDLPLDAAGLPAGVYLVRAEGEAATLSQAVTLVR